MRKKLLPGVIDVNTASSNYTLARVLARLGVPAWIFSSDEIPEDFTGFAVVNHEPVSQPGTHWTGLFIHPREPFAMTFDAFGAPPVDEIDRITRRYTAWYSDRMIQSFGSQACGWFVVAWLRTIHEAFARGAPSDELLRVSREWAKQFPVGDERVRAGNNRRLVEELNSLSIPR